MAIILPRNNNPWAAGVATLGQALFPDPNEKLQRQYLQAKAAEQGRKNAEAAAAAQAKANMVQAQQGYREASQAASALREGWDAAPGVTPAALATSGQSAGAMEGPLLPQDQAVEDAVPLAATALGDARSAYATAAPKASQDLFKAQSIAQVANMVTDPANPMAALTRNALLNSPNLAVTQPQAVAVGLGIQGGQQAANPYELEGKALDAQMYNRLHRIVAKANNGGELTPQEIMVYKTAVAHITGPRTVWKTDSNGHQYQFTEPGKPLPAHLAIPGLAEGGHGAPGQVVSTPGTASPASLQPGGSAPGLTPTIEGNKPITEAAGRTANLGSSFTSAVQEMNKFFGYDAQAGTMDESKIPGFGYAVKDYLVPEEFKNFAMDPQQQEYKWIRFRVVEPMLRMRSGAATPEEEVARYMNNLIPAPGQDPKHAVQRIQNLNDEARIVQEVAAQYGVTPETFNTLSDGQKNFITTQIQGALGSAGGPVHLAGDRSIEPMQPVQAQPAANEGQANVEGDQPKTRLRYDPETDTLQ